jgi:serine/threonine protein phosphatase PrpC
MLTPSSSSYYGVYDGHAGPQCAEILKEALYRNILEHTAFSSGKVPEALHHGFLRTDQQVPEEKRERREKIENRRGRDSRKEREEKRPRTCQE